MVLELARTLSRGSFDANLVFLCVPGEEQGLFGARHFAETAGGLDLRIAGMFTNDIVGGAHDEEFEQDFGHVRVFAGGDAPDHASRELARLIEECAALYVEGFAARPIFHLDRFGRGGDHIPFHEAGVPAVRFTEARELYRRQHKDVSEDGRFGDLPAYVSADYMERVARTNGAALLRLALAPPPVERVRMRGAMSQSVSLSWPAVDGAAAYRVVWRATTSHAWQYAREVEETNCELEGVVPDDYYFGVQSLSADGHASLAVGPRRR